MVKIEFPNVTRFLTIANVGPADSDDVAMRVGFSVNGINLFFLYWGKSLNIIG